MDGLSLWLFASHLSKWAWSKEYCWHSKSVSYLDLHLEIDNGGRLTAKLYDQRDDFTFQIANIPFISSNIPASSAYGVYISQLIHYSRDCAQRSDFLDRAQLLTQRLSKQGCVARKLKSLLHKFYCRHHDLVERYEISISQMTMDLLLFAYIFASLYHCQDLYRTIYMSNTTDILSETGTVYPSRAHECNPFFVWCLRCSSF